MSPHFEAPSPRIAHPGPEDANALAERHGVLVGMECANRQLRLEDWLAEIFSDGGQGLDGGERAFYAAVFDDTQRSLDMFELEFDLLLPGEDTDLTERAEALAQWCRGFLDGVGTLEKTVALSEDSQELLRDLYQIATLDAAAAGEEDEVAFTELSEYVRVGVQVLRAELRTQEPSKHSH